MLLALAGVPVVAGPFVAGADILDTARLHTLSAVALNILVGLDGLVGRDRPVRLYRLVVLDVGVACLDPLNILVALDSLDSLHSLRTFAELCTGLRSAQGLDALEIPCADITELLLE